MNAIRMLALAWLCMVAQSVPAALNIMACTPEWGSLARELGGDKVSVYVATTALQDPHHIEARPSLIARARSADLMVCTGADLEVGWVPLVQTQSGNPKIQNGRPGYFEAARSVALLEIPARVDRALGDVHPQGNPHIHLDPRNIAKVAQALTERMMKLDPVEGGYYAGREKAFLERWRQATARWEKEAAPLKGLPLVVYHRNFSYLIAWLGMREAGSLEPQPGMPPTTSHLSQLLARLEKDPAKAIVSSPYNDPRAAQFLSERARLPAITLAFTVGGTQRATDLFALYDDMLERLLRVVK